MEHLPSDVFLIILHKLAVQDPLSLVRATCSCGLFQKEAEDSEDIWLEAFFRTFEQRGGRLTKLEHRCKERSPEFESEVRKLGGYKNLVQARLRKLKCSAFEQTREHAQRLPVKADSSGIKLSEQSNLTKYLIILKIHEWPFFWGIFPMFSKAPYTPLGNLIDRVTSVNPSLLDSSRLDLYIHASRLQPIYSDVTYEELSQRWAKVEKRFGPQIQEKGLSLEVFAILGQNIQVARASKELCENYKCFLLLREMNQRFKFYGAFSFVSQGHMDKTCHCITPSRKQETSNFQKEPLSSKPFAQRIWTALQDIQNWIVRVLVLAFG